MRLRWWAWTGGSAALVAVNIADWIADTWALPDGFDTLAAAAMLALFIHDRATAVLAQLAQRLMPVAEGFRVGVSVGRREQRRECALRCGHDCDHQPLRAAANGGGRVIRLRRG